MTEPQPDGNDDGVTSVEMAILFPAVLLLVLTMFQISLYWHTANAAEVAAEEGLNAGQVLPDDWIRAEFEAVTVAESFLAATNRGDGSATAVVSGNTLTVTVVANAPRIVGIGTWRVRSVAQGRLEEFVPLDQR